MFLLSRGFGLLATLLVLVLLAPAPAQDGKKKTDKKVAETKKDKGKKAKDDTPPEEKVTYGQAVSGKLKAFDSDNQKHFTVEFKIPDPVKIIQTEQWKAQQLFNISRTRSPIQRQQQLFNFNIQLAQKDLTKLQDYPMRAADNIKVRANFPPTEYDEKGNIKKWTAKELKALRGKTKLPGFPAEYDVLRPGQFITVYLAKPAIPTKTKGTKGIKIAETPVDPTMNRPEVVMILILADPMPPR